MELRSVKAALVKFCTPNASGDKELSKCRTQQTPNCTIDRVMDARNDAICGHASRKSLQLLAVR